MSRQYVLLIMFFLNSELMFLNLFENLYRKKNENNFFKKERYTLRYSLLFYFAMDDKSSVTATNTEQFVM